MQISNSFAAMELLQNSQRTEQAQGKRARLERLEETTKERNHQPRQDLQEYRDRRLETPRDPRPLHQPSQVDKQNFHRFKEIDQLPTRQRHALMTYMDNQRDADINSGGDLLLQHIDYYA